LKKEFQVKRFVTITLLAVLGASTLIACTKAAPTKDAPVASSASTLIPDLGVNANLNGYRPFSDGNAWNTPVDKLPLDPKSSDYVSSIGAEKPLHPDFGANWNGGPFGIPYIVIDKSTLRVPLSFQYSDESDAGPYPVPENAPIEGGENSDGDRHILVLNRDEKKLYEIFAARPQRDGNGKIKSIGAGSGAIWDLTSNKQRSAGWTSADAAGLPIFPGLVRFDEVAHGEIRHALRFTVGKTQRGYITPATHWASSSSDRNLPPMGLRFRLKSDYDISAFPKNTQVILKALKTYGMIVADNGGNWFLSGAPDARWDDEEMSTLKQLRGRDFEAVKTGELVTR
jgi:hypothetical protein